MAISKVVLVEMRLQDHANDAETPVRFTNAPFNVNYNGYDFIAAGELLGIGESEKSYELINDSVRLTLSGVNPQWRSIIDREGFRGAPIDIWLGQLDEGTNEVSTAQFYHRGFAGTPVTEFDEESGTITVQQETTSVFKNLNRNNRMMTTSLAHHQALHPEVLSTGNIDKFFEYTADATTGQETWG